MHDALVILSGIRIRRRCQKQREENELEILLYNYRNCLASDPRDKVFALVGLARGHIAPACIPDYTKSMLEVYRNLAIHLVIAEQKPDVLAHCAYIIGSTSPSLPSWVPDWSQPLQNNCATVLCPGAYKASAGTPFKGRVSGNLDEVFLDGVLLNNVEVLGPLRSYESVAHGGYKLFKEMVEVHEVYLDMFRQSPRYRACCWSAFTRTLIADRDHLGDHLGQRDLSEVYVSFRKLISRLCAEQITKRLRSPVRFRKESRGLVEYMERSDFETAFELAAYGRNFRIFDDSRAGWVPKAAEVGDRIAIFLGATVPILLRPRGNGYIVLGEAYVHEMMDGQAFEGPDVHIETITLV